ncbi:hypothetical protein D3C83_99640 [compost metagenome]
MVFGEFERSPVGRAMNPQSLLAGVAPECMLQVAALDDERELAQAGIVRVEAETGARVVAVHPHRVDTAHTLLR